MAAPSRKAPYLITAATAHVAGDPERERCVAKPPGRLALRRAKPSSQSTVPKILLSATSPAGTPLVD